MTESTNASPAPDEEAKANQEDGFVKLTPALIAFGVVAILLGLGAGLIMSSATFFK